MMDDKLDHLLHDAARTWREPPGTDYDAMWGRIERGTFGRTQRTPSWRTFGIGIAAALVMGVGVGRFAMPAATTQVAMADSAAVADSASPAQAYDRVATELLGRTVLLLTALPNEVNRAEASDRFAMQATELLTSTRLLMDSPASDDVRLKALLEDLEMVLAQIAMLQSGRASQEIDFITDALVERDVVPRIRSAAARLAQGD